MALNDVKFVTTAGGLGRLPAEKDHVSAIIISLSATPAGWDDALGKKYLSLAEAEADGIEDGDADFGLLWYFISEFFRIAGPAELYVIDAADASFTAQNVYNLTSGEVKQAAWYSNTNNAGIATHIGTVKTFANALRTLHAPLFVLTNVQDNSTAVNGSNQTDLSTADAHMVGVLLSGDSGGKGAEIATDLTMDYVPALGAVLGQMAKTKVGYSIGWVAQSNLASGAELQNTCFSDGQAYNAVSDSIKDTLQTKRYIFLRRYPGITGTFVNLDLTCTTATSDFARVRNVRTMYKAERAIYVALAPDLQSPIRLNADGTLAPDSVTYFENKASQPLERMVSNSELSNFDVIIDPDQDVLSTDTLLVQVKLQPLGAAETIEVTIGFAASVA